MGATAFWLLEAAADEVLLFAAIGLLIGGLDDLAVDAIWIARGLLRAASGHERVDVATLARPRAPGRMAVLIGAWDESAVIGAMLRHALAVAGQKFGTINRRPSGAAEANYCPTNHVPRTAGGCDSRDVSGHRFTAA